MVRIEPRVAFRVEPGLAGATALHRPLALRVGEERILRHHDARDGEDAVRAHRVEYGTHASGGHRAHAVGADRACQRHAGAVEQVAPVVLHVDHERVDLRARRDVDQVPHLPPRRGPAAHVQAAHDGRTRDERMGERNARASRTVGPHGGAVGPHGHRDGAVGAAGDLRGERRAEREAERAPQRERQNEGVTTNAHAGR